MVARWRMAAIRQRSAVSQRVANAIGADAKPKVPEERERRGLIDRRIASDPGRGYGLLLAL
jgi:hypothetical protein